MKMRIFGFSANSFVDGEGIRLSIFFQGCRRKCPGCHNPGSWDMDGGVEVDTETFKKMMLEDRLLDGITFSGGEPFLQIEPVIELAKEARMRGLDVWCWTGYKFEELMQSHDSREALKYIDILVDGPFEKDKRSLNLIWRGSTNQRIIDVQKSLEKGDICLAIMDEEMKNDG